MSSGLAARSKEKLRREALVHLESFKRRRKMLEQALEDFDASVEKGDNEGADAYLGEATKYARSMAIAGEAYRRRLCLIKQKEGNQ